jgi:hypothetical protein
MKTLLTLLAFLAASNAWPCVNLLPESEIIANVAGQGKIRPKSCLESPNEPCVCFDGIDWETAVYGDVEVDDESRPIHSKTSVEACDADGPCSVLVAAKVCEEGAKAVYRHTESGGFEAYCTKVVGFEKKLVKKLKEDATKKAAKDARLAQKAAEEAAAAQAEAAASAARQAEIAKLDSATSIAQLKAVLKAIMGELDAKKADKQKGQKP